MCNVKEIQYQHFQRRDGHGEDMMETPKMKSAPRLHHERQAQNNGAARRKGLRESRPSLPFQHGRQNIQRTPLKLEKPRARLELRKHLFSIRVIDAWNAIPARPHGRSNINQHMFKAALQWLPHGAWGKSWKQLPAPRGHLTTRRMA